MPDLPSWDLEQLLCHDLCTVHWRHLQPRWVQLLFKLPRRKMERSSGKRLRAVPCGRVEPLRFGRVHCLPRRDALDRSNQWMQVLSSWEVERAKLQ